MERAEVQGFLEVLQQKAASYVESFKPTEKALRAISNAFEHPIFELQRHNKARSRKLDQYYAATVHEAEMAETGARDGVDPRLMMLPKEIEAEKAAIADKAQEAPRKKYVGRDGSRPTVDPDKKSDFNPLGLRNKDADPPARRQPRTIKGRHQVAIEEASASGTAAASPQRDGGDGADGQVKDASPRAVADRLVRTGFGLAEHLEPQAGRALAELKAGEKKPLAEDLD